MIDSNALPDHIADCVLDKFEHLPAKRKPRERDGNSREWVPLSGIVLSRSMSISISEIDSADHTF